MTNNDLPQSRHQTLLLDQLGDERTKKGSLEQRGIAVITTSGTLVTITLGFVALATRSQSYTLQPAVMLVLVMALISLVAASAAGLLVNLPTRTPVVDANDLADVAIQADWNITDPESSRAGYEIQAQLLIELRRANRKRARALFLALLLEVAALMLVASRVVV
ncbi:hypothetical protein OG417_07935 [Actinoallomurus sp. NBC_01490]|uniref:hypothetical protein n=1 Tax=Actinoallomurus sp. NBC_01490 TaxID=2903557 RepID=UPI002E31A511|nr:hypothetical protein [Actinoallomurus sp. NBC_01490]